ncbi:MAG: hypothetical protein HC881_06705 [Leptolyngbyaceae cyanobacterium SL_7_1]|nr:hypothetical protein [Leptolyngbyaceae cyanobacterium SL_7_1]
MNYQSFIEHLSTHYHHWGTTAIYPQESTFRTILKQIQGYTTPCIMQLLSSAVAHLQADEVYCELGSHQGANLIGALLHNSMSMAYTVDPLFTDDSSSLITTQLIENLTRFQLEERIFFCDQTVEEFFLGLHELDSPDRIGVYYCNASYDYRSHFKALLLAKPFLADRALIVIGNSNWSAIQQATIDFVTTHPQAELLHTLPTPFFGHRTFWNGLQLVGWNARLTARLFQLKPNVPSTELSDRIVHASPRLLEFKPPTPIQFPPTYVQLEQFLPTTEHQDLLRFTQDHHACFNPSSISKSYALDVNPTIRRSIFLNLKQFPQQYVRLQKQLVEVLSVVLAQLNHPAFEVLELEMEMTAHNDGDYFATHTDAIPSEYSQLVDREISYVYYFCREPKAFSGGELKLYTTEIVNDSAQVGNEFELIEPQNNSIVFFNSRCFHEVLPIHCPSQQFADSRFTVNGWFHA